MKMKKAICVLLTAAMLSMTGCSTIPQPTMEELMSEVNAEHQAVEKPEVAVEPYSQYVAPRGSVEQDLTPAEPNPDGSLSMEQAQFDVNSLFDTLHKYYGLYDFYGGDEVFEAARQQALADCESAQTMDEDVLQQILLENLAFITDQHFSINGKRPASLICPCFFTEVAFQKTEDGYSTADGKLVESVDGQNNLDELFKRSLTREGEIVYWPITFAESEEAQNNPPSLIVHYTDGSKQTLTAMAYESPEADPEVEDVELRDEEGIPVLYAKSLTSQNFVNFTLEMQEEANVIDLTSNTGGYMPIGLEWLEKYVGEIVPTNSFFIRNQQNTGNPSSASDEIIGVKTENGWTMLNIYPDDFIENENLLIILTSKKTASAAEMLVDASRNVQNTLIIGENTAGCMLGNKYTYIPLVYSRINVTYGNIVTIFPEEDFTESYGYEPDLWCPAVWAQEAAVHFLNKQL